LAVCSSSSSTELSDTNNRRIIRVSTNGIACQSSWALDPNIGAIIANISFRPIALDAIRISRWNATPL
jgi:hypothetical protein